MKSMKVHKATSGANSFCGPAALSAITGHTVETVCEVLRNKTGKRAIKRLYNYQMTQALTALGYNFIGARGTPDPITLAAWLRRPRDMEAPYLLNLTHHYITVRGRKIFDNHFPDGVWIRQYPHRRKRVQAAWKVFKK